MKILQIFELSFYVSGLLLFGVLVFKFVSLKGKPEK